jgi:predicted RNA-binding protein with PUA-like domain
MGGSYWLMKSEPSVYSIDDLKKDGAKGTGWGGVRNYQARNLLRSMKRGDLALFYHSNAEPPAAVGIMEVTREGEPDPTQFDPEDGHYDADSPRQAPRWWQVGVRFREKFAAPVALERIRAEPRLKEMVLLKRGRLSVQPVTAAEWAVLVALGRGGGG